MILVHDSSRFKEDTMLSMLRGYGKTGEKYLAVVPPPQVVSATQEVGRADLR